MSTTFCIKITQKPQNVVEATKYACPPYHGRPALSGGFFVAFFGGFQTVFKFSFFGSGNGNENKKLPDTKKLPGFRQFFIMI